MKQTAVEWLQEKISYTTPNGNIITYHKDMTKIFEEAKEMEKEQIMDSFYIGSECNYDGSYLPELYYNETFKPE